MFKEFRVSNFKSIQKEQIFTLEACPKNVISEYPDHVIEDGEERLLKVTSIYGPNGGGKSNLFKAIKAFFYIIYQNPLFSNFWDIPKGNSYSHRRRGVGISDFQSKYFFNSTRQFRRVL